VHNVEVEILFISMKYRLQRPEDFFFFFGGGIEKFAAIPLLSA